MSIVTHKKKFGARVRCQSSNFVLQTFFFAKNSLKLAKKKMFEVQNLWIGTARARQKFFLNYYAH